MEKKLKQENQNLWVLKTVHEDKRASQTIDSYEDNLQEYYSYDNFVANSQQITAGDYVILIDKEKILGSAKIEYIDNKNSTKTIRRCPQCPSTTIDKRKTKIPVFRCNKGHEFDKPIEEIKAITKYRATFSNFIPIAPFDNNLKQLRPHYINGYNQNMSMQKLDMIALNLFKGVESILLVEQYEGAILLPDESYSEEEEKKYHISNDDDRETAITAIRLRRGQKAFRDKLMKQYNNTCVVTGCKIIDILEAAHIKPYRGKNDHHPANGLLLRADIHTLFDLNLVSIHPENLTVHFHPQAKNEYAAYEGIKISATSNAQPSQESLRYHFNIFTHNNL